MVMQNVGMWWVNEVLNVNRVNTAYNKLKQHSRGQSRTEYPTAQRRRGRQQVFKEINREQKGCMQKIKYGAQVLGKLSDSRTSCIASVTISASANNFLS